MFLFIVCLLAFSLPIAIVALIEFGFYMLYKKCKLVNNLLNNTFHSLPMSKPAYWECEEKRKVPKKGKREISRKSRTSIA